MKQKHISFIRISCAALLLAGFLTQIMPTQKAYAAQITNRKLTLLAGVDGPDTDTIPDGGSQPGGNSNHLFNFTLPTENSGDSTDDVGSIKFQYCTTAAPVPGGVGCISPTGIDVTGVTLGTETGVTGFSGMTKVNDDDSSSGTKNEVIINRAAASDIGAANTPVSYRFDGVINPSTPQTFFVRIATYNSLDGSGTPIDTGTVAAATSTQIDLKGTMPESLVFCAGQTVGLTGGVPDCGTVSTGNVSFDALFSPTNTSTATSQMAASTNAGQGYAITVNGATLASGTNQITAMSDGSNGPTSLVLGTSQFGMNLIANSAVYNNATPTPALLGTTIAPTSNGTNYRGEPTTNYGTDNKFKFATGDTVADSANGGAGGTDAQIYTVGYVVNVPGSQPAGDYTTTLTYVCTPTF